MFPKKVSRIAHTKEKPNKTRIKPNNLTEIFFGINSSFSIQRVPLPRDNRLSSNAPAIIFSANKPSRKTHLERQRIIPSAEICCEVWYIAKPLNRMLDAINVCQKILGEIGFIFSGYFTAQAAIPSAVSKINWSYLILFYSSQPEWTAKRMRQAGW